MSLGTRVILLYLVGAYFLPAIGLFILNFESAIYRAPELSIGQILYGALAFMTVIVVAWNRSPVWNRRVLALRPPPFIPEVAILLVLMAVVALGFYEGLGRWRYEATGLSENLSLTSITFVMAPLILEALLFAEMFLFTEVPGKGLQRRIVTLLLAAGLALTASGIGPALLVAMAALYVAFPNQFRLLIFRNYLPLDGPATAKFGLIPMIGAGVASLVIAVVVGDMIKTGATTDVVTGYWASLSFREYLGYLVERFATAWISLRVALYEYTTIAWGDVASNLWAPIGNFLFRLDTLTGGNIGISRPYAGSLMRLNYEMISIYAINEREGTSPGLIGGFLMSFPMPFSLAALAGYTYFLRTMINHLGTAFAGAPTWIGSIVVLYFIFPLFASPVDYFLIFDPSFISFAAYAGLALFIRSRSKRGGLRHAYS